MKIAVFGTGNVGGTLGSRWAQKGHRVVFVCDLLEALLLSLIHI